MAVIYFIRHGETDWNAQGRLQGKRDIDLNAVGLRQAEGLAPRLRDLAGPDLDRAAFVASPLVRARRTMEILRAGLDLPAAGYRLDPRLAEMGFGDWEGLTWAEIRRSDPTGAAARDRDRWGARPPGGGESYAMLAERVGAAAREFAGTTVVVAHGGVARALLVASGYLESRAAPRLAVRQGEILVLDGDRWRWH